MHATSSEGFIHPQLTRSATAQSLSSSHYTRGIARGEISPTTTSSSPSLTTPTSATFPSGFAVDNHTMNHGGKLVMEHANEGQMSFAIPGTHARYDSAIAFDPSVEGTGTFAIDIDGSYHGVQPLATAGTAQSGATVTTTANLSSSGSQDTFFVPPHPQSAPATHTSFQPQHQSHQYSATRTVAPSQVSQSFVHGSFVRPQALSPQGVDQAAPSQAKRRSVAPSNVRPGFSQTQRAASSLSVQVPEHAIFTGGAGQQQTQFPHSDSTSPGIVLDPLSLQSPTSATFTNSGPVASSPLSAGPADTPLSARIQPRRSVSSAVSNHSEGSDASASGDGARRLKRSFSTSQADLAMSDSREDGAPYLDDFASRSNPSQLQPTSTVAESEQELQATLATLAAQIDAAHRTGQGAFVYKVYQMLLDRTSQHLIAFNTTGTSFVVNNATDFAREILPKHFKHNNFSSFVRQLNMYGFHKVNKTPRGQKGTSDAQVWEFYHPKFLRGRAGLLEGIKRKAIENDPPRRMTGGSSGYGDHVGQPSPVFLQHGGTLQGEVDGVKEGQRELAHQLGGVQDGYEGMYRELMTMRRKQEVLIALCGQLYTALRACNGGQLPFEFPAQILGREDPEYPPIYITHEHLPTGAVHYSEDRRRPMPNGQVAADNSHFHANDHTPTGGSFNPMSMGQRSNSASSTFHEGAQYSSLVSPYSSLSNQTTPCAMPRRENSQAMASLTPVSAASGTSADGVFLRQQQQHPPNANLLQYPVSQSAQSLSPHSFSIAMNTPLPASPTNVSPTGMIVDGNAPNNQVMHAHAPQQQQQQQQQHALLGGQDGMRQGQNNHNLVGLGMDLGTSTA